MFFLKPITFYTYLLPYLLMPVGSIKAQNMHSSVVFPETYSKQGTPSNSNTIKAKYNFRYADSVDWADNFEIRARTQLQIGSVNL